MLNGKEKMHKHIMSLILFILIIPVLAFSQNQREIRLGTVENLPPFSFYEDGNLKGIDIDVINELQKRLNLRINIYPMPWGRVIAGLQTGTIDGAFSVYENEERKAFCTYIGIVHYDNLGLAVKKGNEFVYSGIESLKGKRVGKNVGVFISDEFITAVKDKLINVEEVNDISNIKKLYLNRIDVIIGVVETMLFYSKELGYENEIVRVNELIQNKRPGYLVLSKKSSVSIDADLNWELSKCISEIMNDGTYNKLLLAYDRYFGK